MNEHVISGSITVACTLIEFTVVTFMPVRLVTVPFDGVGQPHTKSSPHGSNRTIVTGVFSFGSTLSLIPCRPNGVQRVLV